MVSDDMACVVFLFKCLQAEKHCGCDSSFKQYGREQHEKFQQRSSRIRAEAESSSPGGSGEVNLDLDGDIINSVPLTEDDQSWVWGGCGDNWEAGRTIANMDPIVHTLSTQLAFKFIQLELQ